MSQSIPHSYTQPYIVIGALIVRSGKILLLQENHMPDKGKWNIPAGKLDNGEDPIDAVKREVLEESGLTFRPRTILGMRSIYRKDVPGNVKTTHVLRIVFLGEASGDVSYDHGETGKDGLEISDHKWLSPQEVLSMPLSALRYHDIKQCVHDYQSGKSYPLDLLTHIVQN